MILVRALMISSAFSSRCWFTPGHSTQISFTRGDAGRHDGFQTGRSSRVAISLE